MDKNIEKYGEYWQIKTVDNYNNKIIDVYNHDHYTAYEFVSDFFGGYYINLKTDNKKRIIIAKFNDKDLDKNQAFYFLLLYYTYAEYYHILYIYILYSLDSNQTFQKICHFRIHNTS